MFDTAHKMLLAGLGALSMSRERAEKIFDEYVHRGHAEQADRPGFVKDMMDSADKVRADLEELVGTQVKQALSTLEFASSDDIARIEGKLDELLKRERQGQS